VSRVAVVSGAGVPFAGVGPAPRGDEPRRYVAVAQFVAERTPSNAVYISLQHSGSLRYYSGRPAIRFDRIAVGLDQAIADLQHAGWRPYIVLEDWEGTQFKQQFAGAPQSGGQPP